ncbi:MAG: hypothetical protein U9P73_10070, partial [Candidatus Cloacimonadota bacterium]|nr:hypothetical protein [Candidatus Cloacimonadota bacterium]
MKSVSIILIILLATTLTAYEWNEYCPLDLPIYNANFEFENIDILCTNGLLIRTDNEWELYENLGLLALNSVKLDDDNLLVLFGWASNSDGIYKFNLNTHDFELVDWFYQPYFLYYNSTDDRYYAGDDNGLSRSYDGLKWVRDNTWEMSSVYSMNNQNQNFVLHRDTSIYNWQYSE